MWKRKVLRSNWPKTTKKQLICLEEIELNHKRIKERAPNDCPLLASLSTDDQSYGASVCDLLSSPMRMMKRVYLKSNFKMIVTLTSFALLCAIVIIFDFLSYLSCLFFVCSYNSSSPREKWTTIIPTSAWQIDRFRYMIYLTCSIQHTMIQIKFTWTINTI